MFLSILILIIIVFLLMLISMVWPPDSPWAPWWRTNGKTAKAICKLAKITPSDIVYDLGCGDGEVLLQTGKLGAKGVGIEIDLFRYYIAKLRVAGKNFRQNISIKRNNFFKEDISSATVVIVYLVPKTLKKLLPKFKKELKKGTRIISYIYEIEDLKMQRSDIENKIMLYTI